MQIIPPAGLDVDAIVPQCLDNQYTSDAVLDRMLAMKVGFQHREIAELRLEETHSEFIRSLLYASTVVVNRAYLTNPGYLVRELSRSNSAVPKLIQTRAIIPFLGKEKSLAQPTGFAQHQKTLEILRGLEEKGTFQDSLCLRFSEDDSANDQQIRRLGANFRRFSKDLDSVANDSDELPTLGRQLYSQVSPGAKALPEVPTEVLLEFEKQLRAVCKYAQERSGELEREKAEFGRQHIYERFFIAGGEQTPGNVAEGLFRQEMQHPALRMVKKLIDLKYNANLPDMLGRYTLTPANLPGRSALPFETPAEGASADHVLKRLIEFKGRIMDEPPAVLPRLRHLTLDQVLEIRNLDEWEQFRQSQDSLLRSGPDKILHRFDTWQKHLRGFQKRLGRWALEHAPETIESGRKYATAFDLAVEAGLITLFISLAPHAAIAEAGVGGAAASALYELGKDKIIQHLEKSGVAEKIKGITVKLLVRAQNTAELWWDRDHTYQLELMRNNEVIHRRELVEMLQEIQHDSRLMSAAGLQTAEQSSQ